MPATPAAVPDDTEVIPPLRAAELKSSPEKIQRLSASARDNSARKATAHTGLLWESWRKASRYKGIVLCLSVTNGLISRLPPMV